MFDRNCDVDIIVYVWNVVIGKPVIHVSTWYDLMLNKAETQGRYYCQDADNGGEYIVFDLSRQVIPQVALDKRMREEKKAAAPCGARKPRQLGPRLINPRK